jgi:hypothetical protein
MTSKSDERHLPPAMDVRIRPARAHGHGHRLARRIFADEGVSGSVTARRGLDAALAALRPGDTLVVWKLDRLGRSLSHLVTLIAELGAREVNFRSLSDPIDTASSGGRLVMHIMVVIVLAFDTPTPPVKPPTPFPPLIVPPDWLASVVIAQLKASTPSPPGPPVMLPLPVTVIAPPLLKIGPEIGVAMVWGDGRQAARATPDAPSAASAKAEAPASSAARETRP